MCEIAMLKTHRYTPAQFAGIGEDIYTRMSHGLGVVAIIEGGEHYEYEIYRSVAPEWAELIEWFREHQDEATWFAIHGRLATSGERGEEGVHPLDIECEQCDIGFVLHNGIYSTRAVEWEIMDLEDDGHSFQTSIDTELMAHELGRVPTSVDDADSLMNGHPGIKGQGGFIMFGEDNIFIWSNRYVLNEYMEMYHQYRDFSRRGAEENYDYAVLTNTPDPDPEPEPTEATA